jgi:hypothetical protein
MNTRLFVKSICMFTLPAAASAGLVAVALLLAVEPAAAKSMSSCQVKHSLCSERCIMRNNGDGIGSCISRTCNTQHRGCGSESHEKGMTGPKGGKGGKGGRARLVAAPASGPAGDARGPLGSGAGSTKSESKSQPKATGMPIFRSASGADGSRPKSDGVRR